VFISGDLLKFDRHYANTIKIDIVNVVYITMGVCMWVCVGGWVYVSECVCACVYVCACMYGIHIYIYACIHTHANINIYAETPPHKTMILTP